MNENTIDLTPQMTLVYECANKERFETEVEALEYTNKNLSSTIINSYYTHSFVKGDLLYYIEKDTTTTVQVLGEYFLKEWRYNPTTKKQHLTKFNRLATWVTKRDPEGDIGFSLSFQEETIAKLKKYDR